MKNKPLYFLMYSNCIPVKGAKESIICDLQRNNIFEIPNLLFDIIDTNKGRSIEDLKRYYKNQYDEGIDSYFEVFEKEEIGFFTDHPENFPELNLDWHEPKKIQSAIIEINHWDSYDVVGVFKQLLELDCTAIQLRILNYVKFDFIKEVILLTQQSKLKNIELFVPYNENYKLEDFENLIISNPRVQPIIFHSAKKNEIRSYDRLVLDKSLLYTTQTIHEKQKDIVDFKNFIITIRIFSEAQQYNIALNKKVCINTNGELKNYVDHKKSHGNVKHNAISDVVSTETFQEKWHISNDDIKKCRDCQFRYLCFYNSDVVKKDNEWIKVDDCGFNPYENSWNNE
jgi:SPASM domain peptide maturase of grasp-with-spasm system